MALVIINGEYIEVTSDITIKRSVGSVVSTATFSTPLDLLADAQAQAEVVIKLDNTTVIFWGKIQSFKLKYQGKSVSLDLTCSDIGYTISTKSRISFSAGEYAGTAIVLLCQDLGYTSFSLVGVKYYTTPLPDNCYVFPVDSNRFDAIKKIAEELGGVFYTQFTGDGPVAVCDTWDNLLLTDDFTTAISFSDDTNLIISFDLDAAPEYPTADRATIVMSGIPATLFNQVDLSELYREIGISYSVEVWRISDVTHKISSSGVITTAILVPPDTDLSDSALAKMASSLDTADLILVAATNTVSQSLGRVATVTATGTGTVTVEYDTGEEETIDDHGAT